MTVLLPIGKKVEELSHFPQHLLPNLSFESAEKNPITVSSSPTSPPPQRVDPLRCNEPLAEVTRDQENEHVPCPMIALFSWISEDPWRTVLFCL